MPVTSSGTATLATYQSFVDVLENDDKLRGIRSGEVIVSDVYRDETAMFIVILMTPSARERMSVENGISVPIAHESRSELDDYEMENWFVRLVRVLTYRFDFEYIGGAPGASRQDVREGVFRNGTAFRANRRDSRR